MEEKFARRALLALGFALLLAACGGQGEKKAEVPPHSGEEAPPAAQMESSPESGEGQGEGAGSG